MSNRYYDEEGHLRYIMSAKELTDLAKEVAYAVVNAEKDDIYVPNLVKAVLADNGIKCSEEA